MKIKVEKDYIAIHPESVSEQVHLKQLFGIPDGSGFPKFLIEGSVSNSKSEQLPSMVHLRRLEISTAKFDETLQAEWEEFERRGWANNWPHGRDNFRVGRKGIRVWDPGAFHAAHGSAVVAHQSQLPPHLNKFHKGNGDDGKRWAVPAAAFLTTTIYIRSKR